MAPSLWPVQRNELGKRDLPVEAQHDLIKTTSTAI